MARMRLNVKQRERFHRELLARLTELYRAVRVDLHDATVAQLIAQDEPRDEGDESLHTQLRDVRASLGERETRLAQAIEAALGRLAEGTFGVCVDCGRPIEMARLRAVPWTLRCTDDQQAYESAMQERPPTL
jgi:DnaK suppressor protein